MEDKLIRFGEIQERVERECGGSVVDLEEVRLKLEELTGVEIQVSKSGISRHTLNVVLGSKQIDYMELGKAHKVVDIVLEAEEGGLINELHVKGLGGTVCDVNQGTIKKLSLSYTVETLDVVFGLEECKLEVPEGSRLSILEGYTGRELDLRGAKSLSKLVRCFKNQEEPRVKKDYGGEIDVYINAKAKPILKECFIGYTLGSVGVEREKGVVNIGDWGGIIASFTNCRGLRGVKGKAKGDIENSFISTELSNQGGEKISLDVCLKNVCPGSFLMAPESKNNSSKYVDTRVGEGRIEAELEDVAKVTTSKLEWSNAKEARDVSWLAEIELRAREGRFKSLEIAARKYLRYKVISDCKEFGIFGGSFGSEYNPILVGKVGELKAGKDMYGNVEVYGKGLTFGSEILERAVAERLLEIPEGVKSINSVNLFEGVAPDVVLLPESCEVVTRNFVAKSLTSLGKSAEVWIYKGSKLERTLAEYREQVNMEYRVVSKEDIEEYRKKLEEQVEAIANEDCISNLLDPIEGYKKAKFFIMKLREMGSKEVARDLVEVPNEELESINIGLVIRLIGGSYNLRNVGVKGVKGCVGKVLLEANILRKLDELWKEEVEEVDLERVVAEDYIWEVLYDELEGIWRVIGKYKDATGGVDDIVLYLTPDMEVLYSKKIKRRVVVGLESNREIYYAKRAEYADDLVTESLIRALVLEYKGSKEKVVGVSVRGEGLYKDDIQLLLKYMEANYVCISIEEAGGLREVKYYDISTGGIYTFKTIRRQRDQESGLKVHKNNSDKAKGLEYVLVGIEELN